MAFLFLFSSKFYPYGSYSVISGSVGIADKHSISENRHSVLKQPLKHLLIRSACELLKITPKERIPADHASTIIP